MNAFPIRACCLVFFLAATFIAAAQAMPLYFSHWVTTTLPFRPMPTSRKWHSRFYDILVQSKGITLRSAFLRTGRYRNQRGQNPVSGKPHPSRREVYDNMQAVWSRFHQRSGTLLAPRTDPFYEKHGWTSKFSSSFSPDWASADIGKLSTKIINETQADYLGGFLVYSAGYDVFDKGDEFMAALYQNMN